MMIRTQVLELGFGAEVPHDGGHGQLALPPLLASLVDLLEGHPKTLEYILLGKEYFSAVIKSWIESIDRGNWTHVRSHLT